LLIVGYKFCIAKIAEFGIPKPSAVIFHIFSGRIEKYLFGVPNEKGCGQ